jgi:hypothetical protein
MIDHVYVVLHIVSTHYLEANEAGLMEKLWWDHQSRDNTRANGEEKKELIRQSHGCVSLRWLASQVSWTWATSTHHDRARRRPGEDARQSENKLQ